MKTQIRNLAPSHQETFVLGVLALSSLGSLLLTEIGFRWLRVLSITTHEPVLTS